MQVDPSVHKGSLLMSRTTTGNSWPYGTMTTGRVFAALYKNYAFIVTWIAIWNGFCFVLLVCWFANRCCLGFPNLSV